MSLATKLLFKKSNKRSHYKREDKNSITTKWKEIE